MFIFIFHYLYYFALIRDIDGWKLVFVTSKNVSLHVIDFTATASCSLHILTNNHHILRHVDTILR